jgi:hypothetical protein
MSIERFMQCKGQFIAVNLLSTSAKPRAEFKGTVLTKRSRMVCRAGIDFANKQSVKDGIKAGTRGVVGELPWGVWDCFPYLITHKGGLYYRLYPVSVQSVVYMVNGAEVTRDAWLAYLTPSARKEAESGERPECMTVKAENCSFPDATDAEVAYPVAV